MKARFFESSPLPAAETNEPGGSGGCKNGETPRSTRGDVPSDFTVIFGREGGFAGRSMGYSISGTGEVVRWEGKYPGREAVATTGAKEVRRLWRRAEEIGILQMKEQAMATTSSFIAVTAAGESRRVTWVERDEAALTAAQEFFDECMEVAKRALRETNE